jgi:hypothetical protein
MAFRGATVDELESLYRADLPRFVRAAAAIVGDEATGRDVVQEAFAQAVRKRGRFSTSGDSGSLPIPSSTRGFQSGPQTGGGSRSSRSEASTANSTGLSYVTRTSTC